MLVVAVMCANVSQPVPYVGLGFIGFGWGVAGDLALTYLGDCYPDMILEGMVGVRYASYSSPFFLLY